MSRGRIAVTLAAVVSAAAPARAEDPPARATDTVLQVLIDEALARNPQLAAARELERAAAARPVQEGSRPGPGVGVFYQNDGVSPSLGSEPMTMLGLSVSQEFTRGGKRDLRRQVAEADARLAAFDVERARLSLVGDVKRAYYGLLLARGLADLALEHRKVVDEVREVARARYAAAAGSQQDVLRAQVESTRFQALHAQHHAEARARVAEINGLVGRPMDTPVQTPAALSLVPEPRTAAEVLAWSVDTSPELKAAAAAVQRDERAVDLAGVIGKPDLSVQGALITRGGLPPMWQASATLMFPSKAKANGAQAEASARLAADKAAFQAVTLRLRSAVERRMAFLAAAQEIEATYREGLLRQGEVVVQSARAGYAAGPGSQLGILAAAAALIEDRTDYLRVVAAHETERARLEEASLQPPAGIDTLLMHGRSTTPTGGSMGGPIDQGGPRADTAPMSSAPPGMR
jgi:outer membrane protein TolC